MVSTTAFLKTGSGRTAYDDTLMVSQLSNSKRCTPDMESLEIKESGTIMAKEPSFLNKLYPNSINKLNVSSEPFCKPAIVFTVLYSFLKIACSSVVVVAPYGGLPITMSKPCFDGQ